VNRRSAPTLDEYWAEISGALPSFTPEEQRVAVTVYGELAKGTPVSVGQIARALGIPTEQARELLGRPCIQVMAYRDEPGRLVGFGGLAAAPMHHKIRGERSDTLDVVRLGQPLHSRNSRPTGSGRNAGSRDGTDRTSHRDAKWRGVGGSQRRRLVSAPGIVSVRHVGHQCDVQVLPLRVLLRISRVRRAMDVEASRHVLVLAGSRHRACATAQREAVRLRVGAPISAHTVTDG
jgi:hypothetical protein